MPGPDNGALVIYHESTNGMIEYTASNFGGALQGDVISAGYNGKIFRADIDASGKALNGGINILFDGFGNKPLDVTTQGDNGDFPGTIWVCTYGDSKNIHIRAR